MSAVSIVGAAASIGAAEFGFNHGLIVPRCDIVLATTAPDVVNPDDHYFTLDAADLQLAPLTPVVFATDPHLVMPAEAALVLTTLPPELTPGEYEYPIASDLTLTTSVPVVTVARLHHWRRVVSLHGDVVFTANELRGEISQRHSLQAG